MTRTIKITPRELIEHLEWAPGKPTPPTTSPNPTAKPASQLITSIDALLNNSHEFYSEQKKGDSYIGLAVALKEAETNIGTNGVIATMPYLIAGKSIANTNTYLWNKWFSALSEENAGIDTDGKLVGKNEPVVVVLHGGGILNSDRIKQAYTEGFTPQNAAKLTPDEFNNLLKGVLPSGENIELYSVDDVKKGIPSPFGKYGVWMPASVAKSKPSNYHVKDVFMNNELVIARAGTLEYLDAYFEKAKHTQNNNVGNWHRFNEIDFNQSQGRVLFLYVDYDGLDGLNLISYGRFVGVAPEAHPRAKK